MNKIHKTAIISENIKIGSNVTIGPYCIIGDNVELGNNVTLISNVNIGKNTRIGDGTIVYPFAVIGFNPQDLKFEGEETYVVIGKNNVVREYVSIHLATKHNPSLTTEIGDNCLFMGSAHIAHDCKIGNGVILANGVLLGGHVSIDDYSIIGGGTTVHQFSRIGSLSFIGGSSAVTEDIIPYAIYTGIRREGFINGVNLLGLKRHNYSREDIKAIRKAYDVFFTSKDTVSERIKEIESQLGNINAIEKIIKFIKVETSRHLQLKYRNKDNDI